MYHLIAVVAALAIYAGVETVSVLLAPLGGGGAASVERTVRSTATALDAAVSGYRASHAEDPSSFSGLDPYVDGGPAKAPQGFSWSLGEDGSGFWMCLQGTPSQPQLDGLQAFESDTRFAAQFTSSCAGSSAVPSAGSPTYLTLRGL